MPDLYLYLALQRQFAVCTNNDPLIGVIDQGTSSSRFIVFSTRDGSIISRHQVPVQRQHPHSGWVQMGADDIYGTVLKCINHVAADLQARHISPKVISSFALFMIAVLAFSLISFPCARVSWQLV